jgi:hypothetical protein
MAAKEAGADGGGHSKKTKSNEHDHISIQRGAGKKKSTDPPRAFVKSQTHHPPSARGVQKHDKNIFAKSPCRKNFDVTFCSSFFCFIAFSGVSLRWEFKNTTKNVLRKKSCRDFELKSQNRGFFFSVLFYHVFGRFSVRGVQKHDQENIEKMNLNPFLFRALIQPPNTGSPFFFFFAGPLRFGAGCDLKPSRKCMPIA